MATEKKFLDYTGLQAYDTAIKGYTASSENNGMMSSTDKDKLDDLMTPVELTQAEYDTLSSDEKNNGTIYFIKDAVTGGGSGTGSSAQLSELPTATSSFEGMVIQYIGTTGTYTHGYFYECVEDNGSYSWENINVQEGGGTTVVPIPVFSNNSFTYDGTAQGPTVSNLSDISSNVTITNATKIAAGTYTMSIALKDSSKMFWTDMSKEAKTYQYTISEASITPPTVTGSYTFDGNLQQPVISSYNTNAITISGDLSGTDADTYTVTMSLKDPTSAHWSDDTTANKTATWSISIATLEVPSVSNTYTYNGNEQTVSWNTYNTNLITKTGTEKGTNAGDYTVTFSLVDSTNTQWSDNTTADKTVTWTIAKAGQSLAVSSDAITLNTNTLSATVTVSGGINTISVSSSDSTTATASLSGNTITISSVNNTTGTVTVTVTAAGSANYAEETKTITVTCAFKPALVAWSSGTDDQIGAMIDAYYDGVLTLSEIQSVWSIGQTRNVTISAIEATDPSGNNLWSVDESHREQTVQLEILDFNHDDLTGGNGAKALMTVDLKNCLRDANITNTTGSSNTEHGFMNSSDDNSTGWRNCERRKWCNNGFYNALPNYLKSRVKQVDKKTSAGYPSGSTIYTDPDYIFLPSEIEIFGSVTYSMPGEGSRYAWFANANANRYKLPKWSSSYVSDFWWERSPEGTTANLFCYVLGSGNENISGASDRFGLAPAFCL